MIPEAARRRLQLTAAIAGCAVAYHTLFWAPLSAQLARVRSELDEHEHRVERAKRQAARLAQIEKELVALNQMAAEAEGRLPKIRPEARDIDWFAKLAGRAGVNLVEVSWSPSTNYQYFREHALEVTASAKYPNFRRLLEFLMKEERLMHVRELNLVPQENGSQQAVFKLAFFQYME